MLEQFNARIHQRAQLELDAINAKYGAAGEAVVAQFKTRAHQIDDETEASLADARRQRAALAGAAAGFRAAGDSLASVPPQSTAPAIASAPGGCSSDYECGFGSACKKDSGAFRGICAQAVNAYGNPTFQAPRADSIGPGTGDCSFDTDCSVGFRCVKSSGGLRGNCLK
ncbi:MAG TPA: hypothetical protein VJV79_02075, partial [Polyangiaceae bacterium]|nr:hypothetical protein [Polyangiaceae bacterium]